MRLIPIRPSRASLEAQISTLSKQVGALQHTITINTNTGDAVSSFTGNPYPSYSSAVKQLDRMYRGVADWGCALAQAVIKTRAAFILAGGVKPVVEDGAERERAFIEDFIERNDLDEEIPQAWAREAEIEGKALIRLFFDAAAGAVDARFVPWTTRGYQVEAAADDYADYRQATYNLNGTPVALNAAEFVYKRFGGRISVVNETPPKSATAIGYMEAVDRALRDWRAINNINLPTPTIEAESPKAAQELEGRLRLMNWKVGKLLILANAKYSLVGLPASALDSVRYEIETNLKFISGSTDVPAMFLGYPDLMSNRSTSTDLLEMMLQAMEPERAIWRGFYEELFRKAIRMFNARAKNDLDPERVSAEIAEPSALRLKTLSETWLPLYQAQAISLETFLGKIPGIDVADERERLENAAVERAEAALAAMQAGEGTDDPEDDEDEGDGQKARRP